MPPGPSAPPTSSSTNTRALGRRPLGLHNALRRSLLQALLLRLAHSAGTPATPSHTTRRAALHQRLLDALELHFRELHHVDDYARLLGCSMRTLTRAAQDAGHSGARQATPGGSNLTDAGGSTTSSASGTWPLPPGSVRLGWRGLMPNGLRQRTSRSLAHHAIRIAKSRGMRLKSPETPKAPE
ncbi:hypothetical protein ABZ250_08090 [Streptomyces afghaniensis]